MLFILVLFHRKAHVERDLWEESLWVIQLIAEGTGGKTATLLHLSRLGWSEAAASQILAPNQGFLFPLPFPLASDVINRLRIQEGKE